jgi:hypothetical protein
MVFEFEDVNDHQSNLSLYEVFALDTLSHIRLQIDDVVTDLK